MASNLQHLLFKLIYQQKQQRQQRWHLEEVRRIILAWIASLSRYLMRVILQLTEPFKLNYHHPWFPKRLFLASSLFLSLILNGLVASQLASSLSKRLYYENIDTLEKLEESGYTILTNSRDVIEDALTGCTSPLVKRLHGRLKYSNDSEIDKRVFERKDAAFLHRLAPITLKYSQHQIEKLHVVKECPKEYMLAIVTTKGSPFRDRINNILGRLNNGGFYWKWYQSLFQSQQRIARNLHDSTMHRKITMQHLLIPFLILHVGLAGSTIVFIYERQKNRV